jgi:hypothetical protein
MRDSITILRRYKAYLASAYCLMHPTLNRPNNTERKVQMIKRIIMLYSLLPVSELV